MKNKNIILGTLAISALFLVGACTPTSGPAVNKTPLAIFVPSVSTGPAPISVHFDASGASDPDGTVVSYNWDFGDFTTASGVAVDHTFTDAGAYTVTLTVTDNAGGTGSSTTVITAVGGPPAAPTGLAKTGSGCCDTYGDFAWNAVPGATSYQIQMKSYFGGGCLTDASATFAGSATTGRVQQLGLCLGSHYKTSIRAQANGQWGPWSAEQNFVL